MSTTKREIVIVGGGIIGCSTAYYLSRHPSFSPDVHHITLLEASSTSSGGRTPDSIQDPATLADPSTAAAAAKKNPAHDGIAGGASGKAGGLLALWAFPQSIVPLSFRLHDELAREHGGDKLWGYRRCWASQVDCKARLPPGLSGSDSNSSGTATTTTTTTTTTTSTTSTATAQPSAKASASKGLHRDHRKDAAALRKLGVPADLDWVDPEALAAYDTIGTPEDTAQVHPELFTRAMARLAEDGGGVRVVTGARVTAIHRRSTDANADADPNPNQEDSRVEGVTYEKEGETTTVPVTDCVVAAGPWTRTLLPEIPVTAARAHSVVIRTPRPVSAYALFTAIRLPSGFRAPVAKTAGRGTATQATTTLRGEQIVEPEIYARPDGTAYACGPTDDAAPLPLTTAEVEVDEARCEDIVAQVSGISDELGRDGEVLARQACYLPQGGPYIGRVGNTRGLVVAAGHTCWGIQNAPATGKLVSEIVFDGEARSARLGGCDPAVVLG
ncbi:FAD dependent oxidoreductase [Xylaria cf. heliscus]|nr:FAD dependent oxidoreductase [Xylaria cf. heliscus]